ncbi:hypothetical protein [Micromonospora sp. NPDC049204]|uniref:hypothetical protein n=1 Tax=unclassified Micromonospora TaxID=2617518 RepID=UPI0033CDE818
MRTALIVVAALVAAVVVDLTSGVLVRRVARGRYRWLLEPLRHACRRPAAAVLLVGALYYALLLGPAASPPVRRRSQGGPVDSASSVLLTVAGLGP